MDIQKIRQTAKERVENAQYPAGKLALIYAGVSVLVGILSTLVTYLLDMQMEPHVGLGGMDARAILIFFQTLLVFANMLALPLLSLGYTGVGLRTARGESAEPISLLLGFKKFFPAIRLVFFQGLLVFGVMMLAVQLGATLYTMSPASDMAMAYIEQLNLDITDITGDVVLDILGKLWPLYLMVGIAMLVALIPVFYRLRLTEFGLMDGQNAALKNMSRSNRCMRGNCFQMFRLDLSFWWYYLLQIGAALLAYGDLFVEGELAYWGFYLASCVAQVLVAYHFMPEVITTYALAYEELTKE